MKFGAIKPEDANALKKVWLKEGETLVGVFKGDVHDYKIHWIEKKKVTCHGAGCKFCESGDKNKFEFRVNVIHKNAEGHFEASLYENNWFAYEKLNKLNEQFPLEANVVKVSKVKEGAFTNDKFERVRALESPSLEVVNAIPLLPVVEQVANYDEPKAGFECGDDLPF